MGKKSYRTGCPSRRGGGGARPVVRSDGCVVATSLCCAAVLLIGPPTLPVGKAGENLIGWCGFYSIKAKYLMMFSAIDMNNLCKEGQSCCCVMKTVIIKLCNATQWSFKMCSTQILTSHVA